MKIFQNLIEMKILQRIFAVVWIWIIAISVFCLGRYIYFFAGVASIWIWIIALSLIFLGLYLGYFSLRYTIAYISVCRKMSSEIQQANDAIKDAENEARIRINEKKKKDKEIEEALANKKSLPLQESKDSKQGKGRQENDKPQATSQKDQSSNIGVSPNKNKEERLTSKSGVPESPKERVMFLDIIGFSKEDDVRHIWLVDPIYIFVLWLFASSSIALTADFVIPWVFDVPSIQDLWGGNENDPAQSGSDQQSSDITEAEHGLLHGWKTFIIDVIPLIVSAVLLRYAFIRVTPVELLVRQLFGPYSVSMDLLAWRWFSYILRIPGSERITFTPNPGEPGAFISQCKVMQTREGDIGKTLEFLFRFQLQWHLNIQDDPWRVVVNWIDDFVATENQEEAMKRIEAQVINIVIARADEFCQQNFIERFLEERIDINREFLEKITPSLLARGVVVDTAVVDHVEDARGGEYLKLRAQGTEATAKRRMEQQIAEQRKLARIKVSDEGLVAYKREQMNAREAYRTERGTLKIKQLVDYQAAINSVQQRVAVFEILESKKMDDVAKARLLGVTVDELRELTKFIPAEFLRDPTFVLDKEGINAFGILLQKYGKGDSGPAPTTNS